MITRVAVVIGRQDLGEKDRIIRFLSPEDGKMAAIARGARRPRNVLGALDIGARARLELEPGGGELLKLQSADVEDPRAHLRQDFERLTLALYTAELCGALARENQPEPRLYGLLETALLVLDGIATPPRPAFLAGIEAKALTFAGMPPVLDHCAVCAGLPDADLIYQPHAGVAHARCVPTPEAGSIPVEADFIAHLEGARRARLVELVERELPPGPLDILYRTLQAHLGFPLRARAMLSI